MPKFFVTPDKIRNGEILIDTEDVSHISRVLRLDTGDEITVCDSRGLDYKARIKSVSADKIICDIEETNESGSEPQLKVTLFQAIPKASKMEYIIQKNTELGISAIVPVRLSRCVVRVNGAKEERKKLERWQKIAEAAAKQSGRGVIPEIKPFMSLDEVIKNSENFDLFFVPYECEEENTLKKTFMSVADVKSAGFLIGPEGGFDLQEAEKIRGSGLKTVTLGKRILRTETAGEAVLAMMMYEIGDINTKE